MPLIAGFEILGAHPEADGIELRGTVGAIIEQVSVRWCRDGIHLTDRNRNVIIANCHLYHNADVGVYLDDVNLHQINVLGSHISYNAGGGVVVRDGNVRNLQISGCDIEGNMPTDQTPTRAANIWIDVSGSPDDADRSIAEIAITGCTIQHAANYSGDEAMTTAPGGANIRLSGKAIYPIDSVTITGNVLSDTTHNIDIAHSVDVTIGSNTFFAPNRTTWSSAIADEWSCRAIHSTLVNLFARERFVSRNAATVSSRTRPCFTSRPTRGRSCWKPAQVSVSAG